MPLVSNGFTKARLVTALPGPPVMPGRTLQGGGGGVALPGDSRGNFMG